jgi:hypothetical protein
VPLAGVIPLPRTVALKRMTLKHFIYLYLWVAPHVLLIAVALLMVRRGLHKDFPIFFSYLFFGFLQFCLLFTMYYRGAPASWYVTADMICRGSDIALRFGILHEMFESPLVHSVELHGTMARTLRWVTVSLVMLASVFIGSIYYNSLGHRLLEAYVTAEGMNVAQCGLLVLVFLWHQFLGFRMSPFVFGIAVGMGLVSSLEPVIHAWKDSLVAQNSSVPDFLQMATYHCAVLIWLYFAQAREKIQANTKTAFLLNAREWAADLGRVIHL